MKQNYLVIVDMQHDFIDGALGTKDAEAIVPACAEKARAFKGELIFTQDTHAEDYLKTQEGMKLPVRHCIEGTWGWELVPELAAIQKERNAKVFKKPSFGSVELARYLAELYQNNEFASVELIGLCTDICVVSNALLIKAFSPELPISVDASCCAGTTPEAHKAALTTMQSCQVTISK